MRRRIVPDVVNQQELWTLAPDTTVRQAARMMAQRRIGAVMVTGENGRLLGIFSERDMIGRVVAKAIDPDVTKLIDVMTPNPVTIRSDGFAGAALELMRANGFRHLPVVDDGRLIGMVSIRDLYAAMKEQLEDDLKEREAYIFGGDYGVSV